VLVATVRPMSAAARRPYHQPAPQLTGQSSQELFVLVMVTVAAAVTRVAGIHHQPAQSYPDWSAGDP
jgi:hypothetical protein